MRIIDRFFEISNKWRMKYNKLCIQYEELASKKIDKLEEENDYLQRIIDYRDTIDTLKEELMKYKRKYGRLEGGDKHDKNKNKRQV